ncbi:hypothetical protein DB30_08041 [Enhygromyxa salina]|uniref:Uncharacterized protein n=1 Tax=Enhygromyxa salina TaxID=215803 RepID=A0A0C2CV61_9BACT|nr:hypothetical protein [Enhygromyxa salina]KIG13475.1 hypothetical protein DB30_08041 [Enhygromyxa salina]
MLSISRTLVITALLGVILACLGALWSNGAATRRASTYAMATESLAELSLLAGIADDDGELQRDEPMAVEVISDGGPLWVLGSVEQAVAADPHFEADDSPHLLRAEVIDARGGVALQLHLWRAGWELRVPEPRRVRIAVWAAVVAGIFGAALALFVQRMSVGIAAAGVLAQLFLAIDPLPRELFPPRPLVDEWASGPLFGRVIPFIRGLESLQLGVVAAALAGSLVLVAFDHRRTRGRDDDVGLGSASLTALLGTIGVVAWIEAASRGSLFAACDPRFGGYAGWLALAGLILAWLPAIRVSREAWRARA